MDRIYDLLRGVEKQLKDSAQSTILPVPVVQVPPAEEQDTQNPLKPELVDSENNQKESNDQKQYIEQLINKNPNEDASKPNADQALAMCKLKAGDKVKNINTACMHYGSEGIVQNIEELPEHIGYVVGYTTTNAGSSWTVDQYLRKTEDQLVLVDSYDDYGLAEESEDEDPAEEMMEYKMDFFEMSVGSIRAIMSHAQAILDSLDNPVVKDNLTESWLQGKIAITEDYMRTIHDFIMFVSENDDEPVSAADKPGLWENIRRKKEREGKKYRPAKPGDKDRPDPEMWKKLTK
jgi:hypothetical protein